MLGPGLHRAEWAVGCPASLEMIKITTEKQAPNCPSCYEIVTIKNIFIPGVRIVPEFDAPSHVGLGWQFSDVKQFTVCISKEPW